MPAITITFTTYPHLASFLNAFSSSYQNWSILLTHPDFINIQISFSTNLNNHTLEAIHKLAAASGMHSMSVSQPDTRIRS